MTSKERVRIAMTGGVPDRVPVIPQICPPHVVRSMGLPYEETLVDWLRDPRKYDLYEAECALRYGVDGVRIWQSAAPMHVQWEGDVVYQVDPDTGEKLGVVDFMGGGAPITLPSRRRLLTDEDIEAIPVPSADDLLEGEALIRANKAVAEFGDKLFLIGVPGFFTVEMLYHTQGMEQTLVDIVERPDFIERYTERLLERTIQTAIAMARVGLDGFMLGETFGQFMKREQFARLCLPYFQRFVEQLRPYGKPIYLHMCGRVDHLFELMVETGVDCVEPLDPLGGVVIADVKRRIGDKVALMGGVDNRLLAMGTLEQVKDDCARCIREGAPGGGYILACGDMLPTETAPEKVRAMVEAAETLGRYN
jgi:uroporphyrinogen-III decarboxylase